MDRASALGPRRARSDRSWRRADRHHLVARVSARRFEDAPTRRHERSAHGRLRNTVAGSTKSARITPGYCARDRGPRVEGGATRSNRRNASSRHKARPSSILTGDSCEYTYATFALRAGVSVFAVSRFMGSSIAMIDHHYGHLARDSRELAVSFDALSRSTERWMLDGRRNGEPQDLSATAIPALAGSDPGESWTFGGRRGSKRRQFS